MTRPADAPALVLDQLALPEGDVQLWHPPFEELSPESAALVGEVMAEVLRHVREMSRLRRQARRLACPAPAPAYVPEPPEPGGTQEPSP